VCRPRLTLPGLIVGIRDLSSSLAYVSGIPLDRRGAGQSENVLPNTPPLPKYKAVTGSQQLAQVRAPCARLASCLVCTRIAHFWGHER
jgi:hypothetical protein